ncbi:MAG: helix-hairpin-helix domain-containing protein [Planctomycetota bacterium]|nr:helix-hairpin-helix domain-containing protein [Planctomycetota bacterium]
MAWSLPVVAACTLVLGSSRSPWPGTLSGQGHPWQVDLATATGSELRLLPGIGRSRSRAIMEARSACGGCSLVDQLDQVPGIGPVTAARLVESGLLLRP